jgi:ribulose-phosphate 3-epimerase
MGLVVPAVLPSSRADFAEKLKRFTTIPAVSRIQLDVVDGRFASPMSWPYTALQELHTMVRENTMLPHLDRIGYEIDLMCLDAERAAGQWLALGASRLTFHVESLVQVPAFLASVRKKYGDVSATFGLAINVASELLLIEPYLDQVEYVQFMGIASIGKQGQLFDKRVVEKIHVFRSQHPDMPVQVDGGVTLLTAPDLVREGVTNLVVGHELLNAADPALLIKKFEALQNPFGV